MTQWRNPLMRLTGPVCTPGAAAYDEELKVFNPCVRHRPALVVGAADATDIRAAVGFAAQQELAVAVLNTGHGPSLPADSETLMITTRRMTKTRIDPQRRVARVEAGVRFGDLVRASAPHGLAPLTGSSPGVGVVGYTLSGGASPTLGRRYGWAADHVTTMEVVTADGQLRRVTADHNGDLFSALLGGKSNFGVVTAMECALFPVSRVYAGAMYFSGHHVRSVLDAYRLFTRVAPDEISTSLAVLHFPAMPNIPEFMQDKPVVAVRVSYLGDALAGRQLIAPLKQAAPLLADTVTEIPYAEFGSIYGDPTEPAAAIEHFGLLRELTEGTSEAIAGVVGRGINIIDLRHLGGAFGDPPPVPSAVGTRDAAFALFELTVVPPGDDVSSYRDRKSALLGAVAPWRHRNGHPSFQGPSDATQCGVQCAYDAGVYDHLRAIKRKYDPNNMFRVNHNIPPLPDA